MGVRSLVSYVCGELLRARYDLTELGHSCCDRSGTNSISICSLVGSAGTPTCMQKLMNLDWLTVYDILVLAAKLFEMRSSASLSKWVTANPVAGWWGIPTLLRRRGWFVMDWWGLPEEHSCRLLWETESVSCAVLKKWMQLSISASEPCPCWIVQWSCAPLWCYCTALARTVTANVGPRWHRLLWLGLALLRYVLVLPLLVLYVLQPFMTPDSPASPWAWGIWGKYYWWGLVGIVDL